MDDYTERVRQRAYQIWLEEGRPQGREAAHWDMARELVAIEDRQKKTTKPVRHQSGDKTTAATRAEPAAPAAAMGELPTMTDEGEQTYPPSRAAERAAVAAKPKAASRSSAARERAEKAATQSTTAAASRGAEVKSTPAGTSPVRTAPAKAKPGKRGKT